MLPPILPLSVVPITSAHDPVRPRPDIPPVTAAQASSGDSVIDLKHHDADQAALLLREEQQRQHDKRRREARLQEGLAVPGEELMVDSATSTTPVVNGAPRQGLWVDIEV